jgi:hypothetical protein
VVGSGKGGMWDEMFGCNIHNIHAVVYGQQLAAMAAIYWLFVIGAVVFESVDVSLTLALGVGKLNHGGGSSSRGPLRPYYQLLY